MRDIISSIKWSLYEFPYREMSWWRKAWVQGWEYVERFWGQVLRPHVVPRRWYRERRDFWKWQSVPENMVGFAWETDHGYAAELREQNGTWSCGRMYGDSAEEAKDAVMEVLDIYLEEAGTRTGGGWSVFWYTHEPEQQDLTWVA